MIEIGWLASDQPAQPLVDIFLAGTDETFISHSELMFGRAEGPGRWSPDLAEQLAAEFQNRRLQPAASGTRGTFSNAICAFSDGTLVGFANVQTCLDVRLPFGVVEDAVVARHARGRGIFGRMLSFYRGELKRLGVSRVFLESGAGNVSAHETFEKYGFRTVSVTMMAEI